MWTPIDVRAGAKGPRMVESVTCPVVARTAQRQAGQQERAVVVREWDRAQHEVVQGDFALSNGTAETSLAALVRVAKAAPRLAEGLQRSKSEAGLAD